MDRMVLGTAQLGMQYGINNCSGKPLTRDALKILDCAYSNGIRYLDTASAYGNSEEIIGMYTRNTGNKFKICTKFPIHLNGYNIEGYYKQSVGRLYINGLYIYYLHRFGQCKIVDILKQLILLKQKGAIENIGVSVYEPEELLYIIKNLSDVVDIVQLPFNLLDNKRWIQNSLLEMAKEKGIDIYARSIFLQGLLLCHKDSRLCREKNITGQIKELNNLAESLGYSMAQLAVNYVCSVDGIRKYLVGCETYVQLKENIDICFSIRKLDKYICNEIQKISSTTSREVIDPRKWDS